jgi:putative ABC transport system substrate-binding protein
MTVSSEQSAVGSKTPREKRVTRRVVVFICLLFTVFLRGLSAEAQQPKKIPRLGVLTILSPDQSADIEAFRRGLGQLGYLDGKNIGIEYRYADGKLGRLPALATELVDLKVDVIVALNPPSVRAAKNATRSIPIIMRSSDDPGRERGLAPICRLRSASQ